MSYSPTADRLAAGDDRIRRGIKPLGLGVLVVSTALTTYGAHNVREIIVVVATLAVVTGVVYGWLLPRKLFGERSGNTALLLAGLAALLLLPAFWSGLPLVLGAAGALLGYAARHATSGSRAAAAAIILGLLACLGYFAVYVLDTLHQMGVTWA